MNYPLDLYSKITPSTPNLCFEVSEIFEEDHSMNYSFDVYWSITSHSKSILEMSEIFEENRTMNYSFDLYWSIKIQSKPILRSETNIRRKSYYELFVWFVLINHDPLQIYASKWAKYSKKIILSIILLIYVYRSRLPR